MTIDAKTKQRWREQIIAEYPNLHGDMVDSLLDVYDKDKDWLDDQIKVLKKEHKGRLETKNQLTLDELERLNAIGLAKVQEINEWYQNLEQTPNSEEVPTADDPK